MIDVSAMAKAEPCPRCSGRRVWAVHVDTDQWCCAPNAMPFPFKQELKFHDATASADDVESAMSVAIAAQRMMTHG